MKALTVQQPWAWAIIHGGKDVENRTQAYQYRGPLAIHAGKRLSERGCNIVPDLLDVADHAASAALGRPTLLTTYAAVELTYGAIIGVVDLLDVHEAVGDDLAVCCSSIWGETSYVEHGGRTRRQIMHLELANPRPVTPIQCRGALGLWTPPREVLDQLEAVLS